MTAGSVFRARRHRVRLWLSHEGDALTAEGLPHPNRHMSGSDPRLRGLRPPECRLCSPVTNSEADRQQWAGFGSCDHGISASWEVNRPPLVVGALMGSDTSRPWGSTVPTSTGGSIWVTPVAVSASAYPLGEAHSNRVPCNCRNWNWWPASGIVCTAAAGFPGEISDRQGV
jgi:hypothetical protein